jgi:hypothetical protein
MGIGIVGIEIDGSAKFLVGHARIPHPVKRDEGERGVSVRKIILIHG